MQFLFFINVYTFLFYCICVRWSYLLVSTCVVLGVVFILLCADHSSRGVLPTVMRCVWSRNLKNEEVMARVGPQRQREKNG